jgi:HSP20 family molecular chaperone IbpA
MATGKLIQFFRAGAIELYQCLIERPPSSLLQQVCPPSLTPSLVSKGRVAATFGQSARGAIDMSEDDKAFKISAELPGIDAKDIDVSLSGDTLVLKGEKRQEKEEKDKNYHFSERSYGSFQRSFQLPLSIDRDKVAADFSNGVLTITLAKTAEAQKPQKKIEVKSS